jgi:hypothetical protein
LFGVRNVLQIPIGITVAISNLTKRQLEIVFSRSKWRCDHLLMRNAIWPLGREARRAEMPRKLRRERADEFGMTGCDDVADAREEPSPAKAG